MAAFLSRLNKAQGLDHRPMDINFDPPGASRVRGGSQSAGVRSGVRVRPVSFLFCESFVTDGRVPQPLLTGGPGFVPLNSPTSASSKDETGQLPAALTSDS